MTRVTRFPRTNAESAAVGVRGEARPLSDFVPWNRAAKPDGALRRRVNHSRAHEKPSGSANAFLADEDKVQSDLGNVSFG